MFCWAPTYVVLGMALLSPLLWRASGGTRFAAFGYIGMPVGMALIAPFAGLPASIAPYAITAAAFALTGWLFLVDSRNLEVSIDEGWVKLGKRHLAFDDVTSIRFDAMHITTRRTFSSSEEDVQRLVLTGKGTTIVIATPSYRGNVIRATAAVLSEASQSMLERICAALAAGESVQAGPIRFTPTAVHICRPSGTSIGMTAFILGILAFFPAITIFAADAFKPSLFLSAVPLVLVIAGMVFVRHWRQTHPLEIPASAVVQLGNGQLVVPHGSRDIGIEIRFLANALLVPQVLEFLRERK